MSVFIVYNQFAIYFVYKKNMISFTRFYIWILESLVMTRKYKRHIWWRKKQILKKKTYFVSWCKNIQWWNNHKNKNILHKHNRAIGLKKQKISVVKDLGKYTMECGFIYINSLLREGNRCYQNYDCLKRRRL